MTLKTIDCFVQYLISHLMIWLPVWDLKEFCPDSFLMAPLVVPFYTCCTFVQLVGFSFYTQDRSRISVSEFDKWHI